MRECQRGLHPISPTLAQCTLSLSSLSHALSPPLTDAPSYPPRTCRFASPESPSTRVISVFWRKRVLRQLRPPSCSELMDATWLPPSCNTWGREGWMGEKQTGWERNGVWEGGGEYRKGKAQKKWEM